MSRLRYPASDVRPARQPVPLDDRDPLEMVGQRPCSHEAGHARADHDGVTLRAHHTALPKSLTNPALLRRNRPLARSAASGSETDQSTSRAAAYSWRIRGPSVARTDRS